MAKPNPLGEKLVALLNKEPPQTYTSTDLMREFGVSRDVIHGLIKRRKVHHLLRLEKNVTQPKEKKPDLSKEAKLELQIRQHTKVKTETDKKYRFLMDELHQKQMELDALLATRNMTAPYVIKPQASKKESVAVACAVLSDTHYEEEVRPSSIGGKNVYNLDIAKKRNDEFFYRIVKMIRKERQDVVITEMVLGVLGDLITGNIHDDVSMDSCLLGPIDACIFAQDLVASGIKYIRTQEPKLKITVVCKFGNHSRMTRYVHTNNEGAYATEKLIYSNLSLLFKEDKNINFLIEDGYHTITDILGHRIRWSHGHFVKYQGGVGGLTIPLNKAIAGWNTKLEYADLDVMGHFHSYLPNDYDRFHINGSMIGFNTFAVAIKAKYQRPMQSFFLIDRDRGKTVTMPIFFTE